MRFVSFSPDPAAPAQPGVLAGETVVALPFNDLEEFIKGGPEALTLARSLAGNLGPGDPGPRGGQAAWPRSDVILRPPLTHPPSLRDFYAFEEHVVTAHANRGKSVPQAWYEIPVFYFSNPNALFGPEDPVPHPAASRALDFELEVAGIIGIAGRNIPAEQALHHVFGFTIFNDWSARDLQRQEMAVGLGPAKGKDFASSLGPALITPDELADQATGRAGVYDLTMTARVNGVERSRGNWKDIHYSFGQIIARASADVTLLPGDVLGSGTVGTGCLLELTRGQGPWLQIGDVIELEVEGLGVLRNTVSEQMR